MLGSAPYASAIGQVIKTGFDDQKAGAPPAGWVGGFFGSKGNPRWQVVQDSGAASPPNVLRQSGKATYSWLVAPSFSAKDGSAACQFKIESGKEDPEAGLIVRFVDGKNYYYVRANVLEHDVIFYRMVGGKKEMVKRVETKVERDVWHKLSIEFAGEAFKVTYDGKGLMSLKDDRIKSAGSVGVWTTADTVADFDDFEASSS